jgi:hypothetical protein
MKTFNPDNVKLLMTDTDSLVLYIKNEDPYEVMLQNKSVFDMSEYPKGKRLHDCYYVGKSEFCMSVLYRFLATNSLFTSQHLLYQITSL